MVDENQVASEEATPPCPDAAPPQESLGPSGSNSVPTGGYI